MRRALAVTLGTLVAAPLLLTGTAASASPAAAAASPTSYCAHINGGQACFQPNGEFFSATDTIPGDDVRVVAYWSASNGQHDHCGNYLDTASRITCNEDIPEGVLVRLRVALLYDGRIIDQSDPAIRARA